MTQTSNELSATHNAKKKKCLSFARERKARFHRSRRAISSAMTSRSGAPTFSSRARAVARCKKRSRVPSSVLLSRALFRRFSIQNVVPSQRVCLSLLIVRCRARAVSASTRPPARPPARARRRRNVGFSRNDSRFFVCFFFVRRVVRLVFLSPRARQIVTKCKTPK